MKLSEKTHWDKVHKWSLNFTEISNNIWLLQWLETYQLLNISKKYINESYKSIFEIWCAPWNYLIKFYKKFHLSINGIEYSEEWIKSLNNNFLKYNIKSNIIYWDFFNETFLAQNEEKYDITYSLWFIEHFDNPEMVIEKHFRLTKKWWLIIIAIPNLLHLNKLLTPKKIVNIHNLDIMNLAALKKYFEKYNLLELKYSWGLFNLWLFFYDNWFLEKIRLFLFILQRVIIDPIFIILYKFWIDLSNKYTSPQIIIIAKK